MEDHNMDDEEGVEDEDMMEMEYDEYDEGDDAESALSDPTTEGDLEDLSEHEGDSELDDDSQESSSEDAR